MPAPVLCTTHRCTGTHSNLQGRSPVPALCGNWTPFSKPGRREGHAAPRAKQRCNWQNKPEMQHAMQLRALDLDALMPDIDAGLRSFQEELGAEFTDSGVVSTYGNEAEAAAALERGCVVVDRSNWGRVRVGGRDRLRFLHSQTTNAFTQLQPGQACETVLVTAQARTIDLATALVQANGVLLILSPETTNDILQRLDKYILYGDEVTLTDVSERCCMLSLLGPLSLDILQQLGAPPLDGGGPEAVAHTLMNVAGSPAIVAAGGGLPGPGYTIIADEAVAGDLFHSLVLKGAVPMGEDGWERARVAAGRPRVGAELTEEHNPFEAGLYHAVSLDKGCYMGQETLAKVANLNALKQQLWGLQTAQLATPGDAIFADGARVGQVTSVMRLPNGSPFALGYIRCKSKGAQVALEAITVEVNCAPAKVVALPAATRAFPQGSASAAAVDGDAAEGEGDAGQLSQRAEAARALKVAEAEAAEAAKAERLRAMQERLAAWQSQQQAQQSPDS